MFDSGADRSILNAKIFNQLPANIKKLRVESRICLCAVGKADREIKTDGEIKLPVVNQSIFLGRVNSVQTTIPQSELVLTERVYLPPRSAVSCSASIKGPIKKGLFVFSPLVQYPDKLQVDPFAREFLSENNFVVRLRNLTESPLKLPRKLSLGSVDFDCTVVAKVNVIEEFKRPPAQSDAKKDIPPLCVDTSFEPAVKNILNDFSDLIASSNLELGNTSLIQHHINTQGNQPIRQRPYRSARKDKEEIERQIKEMFNAGIIQDSTSPWAAPVILVEKKEERNISSSTIASSMQ